jgi:hypothetical protein
MGSLGRQDRLVFYIVVLWVLFVCQLRAETYYVAPSGNDAGPGTEAQPWRTIKAAGKRLQPGDTVYIKAGTYRERVIPSRSGTPGKPITYAAFPGDAVTIDGAGIRLLEYTGLIYLGDKQYIIVQGFRVISTGPHLDNAGILADGSSHIFIRWNYTYNTISSGIGVWDSSDVIVDSNEVELACNDGRQECLTVAGTYTFEVKNNYVHHGGPGSNGGEGIVIKDGSSNGRVYNNHVHDISHVGLYLDAWNKHTFNIQVFSNIVHNCGGDGFALASEQGGLLENISLYNNIAYDNYFIGITIAGAWGGPTHPMKNIAVVNNTFYHNGNDEWGWGGGISIDNNQADTVIVRNNISSRNRVFQIQCSVKINNLAIDHNLTDGRRSYPDEIRDRNNIHADPGFVDATRADFHLLQGSAAIDSGSSEAAPGKDFEFGNRPAGNGCDIGAYECGADNDIQAPVELRARPRPGGKVRLRWKDASSNETGFRIERKTEDDAGWHFVAEIYSGIRKYIDINLNKDTLYYYSVRAFNDSGFSFHSNIATTRTY